MSSTARRITDSGPTKEMFPRSNEYFLSEEPFLRMLNVERKRTERSNRRFILMLMDLGRVLKSKSDRGTATEIADALVQCTRETDIKGWYQAGSVLGVIFTEIGTADGRMITNALLGKITKALGSTLSIEQINEIGLSFHVFPEDWDQHEPGGPGEDALYGDLRRAKGPQRADRFLKRTMDIVGSIAALWLFAPLIAVIAVLIKLGSRGPVLFSQQRIGQYGNRFTFFKFRSMYCDNDSKIHEEYIRRFISSPNDGAQAAQNGTFKLTADPRITTIGRFLRKTSLDELPQLLNVLKGDMSLVGPRPPIPYEFEQYHTWHKRRLLTVKPGITGLWQVEGRSRVPFDEMVRMDLQYAGSRSLWMDLKILFRTPAAVLSGKGAY